MKATHFRRKQNDFYFTIAPAIFFWLCLMVSVLLKSWRSGTFSTFSCWFIWEFIFDAVNLFYLPFAHIQIAWDVPGFSTTSADLAIGLKYKLELVQLLAAKIYDETLITASDCHSSPSGSFTRDPNILLHFFLFVCVHLCMYIFAVIISQVSTYWAEQNMNH